jgi:8-oxo-dGTP diphosphatase
VESEEVRVVAAVICQNDQYLICQRPWSKRHGGLWEFPGGKIEGAESDADAIRRELREELGIAAIGIDAPELALKDPQSPFLIVFLPVLIEGKPLPREHLQIRWVSVSELRRMPLAPSDRVFVEYLASAL